MRQKRGSIVAGSLLILVGIIFLIDRINPNLLAGFIPRDLSWPWYIIGAGLIFLFFAILFGTGGLAVPATIISSVGGILYYQSISGDWESWSFAWALIPAAVGLGIIIGSIIDGHWRGIRAGLWLLVINLILFAVFWGAFRRDSQILANYWPVLVIAFGVVILLQSLFSRKRT